MPKEMEASEIDSLVLEAVESLVGNTKSSILAVFRVGSTVTENIIGTGDIDLVIVLRSDAEAKAVYLIGKQLRITLSKRIGDAFLFCDPICEHCEFAKDKFRVHMIPHFYRRLRSYIADGNPVVYSWAANYRLIYGKDYLRQCRDRHVSALNVDEPWGIEDLREHLYAFVMCKDPASNNFAYRSILQYIGGQVIALSARLGLRAKSVPTDRIQNLLLAMASKGNLSNCKLLELLTLLDNCLHRLKAHVRKHTGERHNGKSK